jgi:antitoxin ParD1/3/4
MSMTITLELSPEVETKLRAEIARHDIGSVRQLLADTLIPTVEALLWQIPEQLSEDEFETLADQLAAELVACLESDAPILSDYAVSRAGIYEDHP